MARIALTVAGAVAGGLVFFFFPPGGLATWQGVMGGGLMGGTHGVTVGSLNGSAELPAEREDYESSHCRC